MQALKYFIGSTAALVPVQKNRYCLNPHICDCKAGSDIKLVSKVETYVKKKCLECVVSNLTDAAEKFQCKISVANALKKRTEEIKKNWVGRGALQS